jgi:hypothetical protein
MLLTEQLRKRLKDPLGKLYRGSGTELIKSIEELKSNNFMASVGDIVCYYLCLSGHSPEIMVVDGKTMRRQVDVQITDIIQSMDYRKIKASNPPGSITKDLVLALEEAVNNRRSMVFVNGEEDLSVLPLIMLLPEGSIVLYGQPSEGIVVITVDQSKKTEVCEILRKMEGKDRKWILDKLCGGNANGH